LGPWRGAEGGAPPVAGAGRFGYVLAMLDMSKTSPSLMLTAQASFSQRQVAALRDLREAIGLHRLVLKLGLMDIRLRYRGSMLGPFWLTLSTSIMVAALGLLYSQLLKINLHDYLPFLSISLILWNSLSAMVGESCTVFIEAEANIRSMRMPFFVYIGRVIVRNQIALAHNLVVIVVVFTLFSVWPGRIGFVALIGYALWLLDSVAACLLFGSFCARFRDIPPIIASVLQIAFFVSPIIWKPETLGGSQKWLALNPFYTLLEVTRGPLLGQMPGLMVWASALGFSVVLCAASWLLFARVRGRLAFWV
jgi:lipopolysaccharide transport system permease protein